MSDLKDDQGQPLELKEGIVVDQDGTPLARPHRQPDQRFDAHDALGGQNRSRVFVFRPNPFLAPLIAIPVVVLIFSIGLTILAALAVLAVIGAAIYGVTKLFRKL